MPVITGEPYAAVPVNLDAIEEETQLQTQNEDLVKQVADIDSARTRLEELIAKLKSFQSSTQDPWLHKWTYQ